MEELTLAKSAYTQAVERQDPHGVVAHALGMITPATEDCTVCEDV